MFIPEETKNYLSGIFSIYNENVSKFTHTVSELRGNISNSFRLRFFPCKPTLVFREPINCFPNIWEGKISIYVYILVYHVLRRPVLIFHPVLFLQSPACIFLQQIPLYSPPYVYLDPPRCLLSVGAHFSISIWEAVHRLFFSH